MTRSSTRAVSRPPTARDSADLGAAIDAFRRILRALRLAARRTELATGLSAAQSFVLSAVAVHPGSSVADVAATTMTDRSSAAAIIDRLIERGYVAREQAESDRRRAAITLTRLGRAALRRASPPATTVLIEAIQALRPAERRGLAAGLTAMTEFMGVVHEPAGMLFEDELPTARKRVRRSARSRSAS